MKKRYGKDVIIHWKDTKRWCGMPLTFTHYYILEKPGKWIKLFFEKGFLHTELEEVHLYKIDDFSIFNSVINKLYGVGNIDVYFNDSTHTHLRITRVKNVFEVSEILTTLIEKDKTRRNIRHSEIQKG